MNPLSPLKKILGLGFVFLLVAVVAAVLPVSGFAVRAQTIGTASPDGVDISFDPSNPAPGTSVTVTVDSYSTDLNAASISWLVNGKLLTKGNGLTSIDVISPATGKSTQVVAEINTSAGANIKKIVTITSGDVDLIWETSGYVPPLFRGKVPFVYQNTVKFTAVPHFVDKNGKAIDPSQLIYKWSNGSTVLGDQSGYGKQSMTLTGGIIPRELDIDVLVSSIDGASHGEAQLALNAVSPTVTFYQDDPLYGVLYTSAIADTLMLSHNEVKVLAAPYGFDIADPALTYGWSVNNASQDNLTASRSIVLRVTPGQKGSSNISLTMSNAGNNILQGATAAFTALFNTTKQTDNSASF